MELLEGTQEKVILRIKCEKGKVVNRKREEFENITKKELVKTVNKLKRTEAP